ncbi:hypothetical protein Tco_0064825 [Tanacetum coccineum]
MASVTSKIIWILKTLHDLEWEKNLSVKLFCDSHAAIKIPANPVFHERTKHLETDLHFVREKFCQVSSVVQPAGIFTKGLDKTQHDNLVLKLGMVDLFQIRRVEAASGFPLTPSKFQGNDITTFCDDVKREIDHVAGGKLYNKNAEESWKIIENLALYADTERMERFEEYIYKQREEINERMAEMFSLLKEFTKGKSSKKVLVTEEVNKPVTKYVNFVSLVRMGNDKDKIGDELVDKSIMEPIEPIENEEVIDGVMDNKSDKSVNGLN